MDGWMCGAGGMMGTEIGRGMGMEIGMGRGRYCSDVVRSSIE